MASRKSGRNQAGRNSQSHFNRPSSSTSSRGTSRQRGAAGRSFSERDGLRNQSYFNQDYRSHDGYSYDAPRDARASASRSQGYRNDSRGFDAGYYSNRGYDSRNRSQGPMGSAPVYDRVRAHHNHESGDFFSIQSAYEAGHSSIYQSGPLAILASRFENGRIGVIVGLLAIFALVLCCRLFWVQVIDDQNNYDPNQVIKVASHRGTIYDRNGVVLATTVDAYNVYCHPHVVKSEDVDRLANAMVDTFETENLAIIENQNKKTTKKKTSSDDDSDISSSSDNADDSSGSSDAASEDSTPKTRQDLVDSYKKKITSDANFVYLYRSADADLAQQIKDMKIEGVDLEKTYKRVYPCGKTASQLIGILDSDGNPVSGLEYYYNDILGGKDGEKIAEYSQEGIPIPGKTTITSEVVNGQDIVVSIDVEMQEQVEKSLSSRVVEVEGKGGSGIVMDSATGEIYACASYPTFDITDLSDIKDGATNLSGISGSFEPGSIFKPITMLAALEQGTTQAGQTYWCPASISVDTYRISDSHDRASMDMDTSTIMAESSNVGMSLIAKDLGFENLYNYILKYKVTEPTGVDYPGEASGYITDRSSWSEVQGYNIAFGQGLRTTPIAMTRFYAAIANNGWMPKPHFLISVPARDENPVQYDTEEVITNKDSIAQVTSMLEAVVQEGTGTQAKIKGFSVAGKTGTAEVASEEGGYKKNIYNISFVGFIPNSSTNLVCFVGATDVPGERKTVPAFKDIMSFAIDRYNITQK